MAPLPPPDYLSAYPAELVARVRQLISQGRFAAGLLARYPLAHPIRTDRALHDYVQELKQAFLRRSPPLGKVAFDSRLQTVRRALGTHTAVSRVQGSNLAAKREIRIAGIFREMPEAFLRMIVVHELAHLRETGHGTAFRRLCLHMEPAYPQYEFDLRCYLSYLDAGGAPLWPDAACCGP